MASNSVNDSRERLLAGVRHFQRKAYPQRKAEYQQLVREGQKPHALFITCADSIIEYAVAGLQVSQVVVCGHSDCGAMKGLSHPEKGTQLPVVKSWLRHGEAALSVARNRNTAPDEHSAREELIEENVALQPHHLRTHPSVAGRLAQDTLALSGWVYDIGHGIIRIHSEEYRRFIPVASDEQAVAGSPSK